MTLLQYIRNFAIVAHIDHGKSTLADRLLEKTGTIEIRLMQNQILDSNPIERERGITIKLAPVRMRWKNYILNLIDTPGHVDFSYEVSRSLSACEGIILVVDATQGIQAQTVAHMQLIKSKNLKVIPVVNKIDLPTAKVAETKQALVENFGFRQGEILEISAKTGLGVENVLEAISERIPSPHVSNEDTLRALVFSSVYDPHRGVIVFVRIYDGWISLEELRKNYGRLNLPPLEFAASKVQFLPVDIGVFTPSMESTGILSAGEVGYIATGLKDITQARVGDTIIASKSHTAPLPGYQEPKSMVFLSFFPTENEDYLQLRESLEKLHLSDGSFTYKPHASLALGKGFLCGFLGLLHADIVKERLEREFSLNIITTAPTVEYEIILTKNELVKVRTPEDFPDPSRMKEVKEPIMYATIYSPSSAVGGIMQLCKDKRGEYINLEYVGDQAKFTYLLPLSEMIVDFFDSLKSISSGYASLDYEFYEMRVTAAVKLEILLNRKTVDAFSQIVVRKKVQFVAERLVNKLREVLPRQQFPIPIQAAIDGKVIARADVKSYRKDVTQKLYGGDRTRKDKLLEAQKKGKKRMRQFGDVEIPSEVFFQIYTNK